MAQNVIHPSLSHTQTHTHTHTWEYVHFYLWKKLSVLHVHAAPVIYATKGTSPNDRNASHTVQTFNSCTSRPDVCQCLFVQTRHVTCQKNKPSTPMTDVACESKVSLIVRSSMRPYPGNWVAIGRAVSYHAQAARAFSTGIKCRHCNKLRPLNHVATKMLVQTTPYCAASRPASPTTCCTGVSKHFPGTEVFYSYYCFSLPDSSLFLINHNED